MTSACDLIDITAAQRSLLGVSLGDSLGLPYEGLSGSRGVRMFPLPVRQRLLFGSGFVSDDTVLSALLLRALCASISPAGVDEEALSKHFARLIRKWFLSIPPGVGLSTVKACLRLCVGIPARRSGVPSAGNGAAMRVAVIGAALAKHPELRIQAVAASTRVTHTDPRAISGAQLVALAAALQTAGQASQFDAQARDLCPEWQWNEFGTSRGPTGYVVHSVNAALRIWQEATGFEDAMERVIRLGGDTDTVGAMVGGILGAVPGDYPKAWDHYHGWPQAFDISAAPWEHDVSYVRLLLPHLAALPIVLLHGFRRLAPPYGS